jgi:hypothetical protein
MGTMARWVAVSIGLALQFGCSLSPDPAIRLADCVEDAVDRSAGSLSSWADCDLKMRGSYLIVLHPQGDLADDQLMSAGLPKSLLPEFRALRIGERPAIYVIATGPDVSGVGSGRTTLSSWTTSQNNFVQIDRVMILARDTQHVSVDVGGPIERRVIARLN